ncbi:hypothetical protein CH289_03960 [Rhodococcus sp. RS1C4]|nr:hypothetical protein [Rhodococcus sp. RS1C4]OZC57061.1 hypothetical protein CH289_03960 [Rhodococcus sp. RS1C4]
MSAAPSPGQLIEPQIATSVVASVATEVASGSSSVGFVVPIVAAAAALPLYAVFRSVDRARPTVREKETDGADGVLTVLATPGMWRALTVSGAVMAARELLYQRGQAEPAR